MAPYLLIGAAAGGFINGLAGFGTALFALGFFLTVLPPVSAVAIVVAISTITGLQGVWEVRNAILTNKRRLFRFLIPGILGVPVGLAILGVIDARALKLVVASFLVFYGGYFSLRRNLPRFERPTPVIDSLVGLAGGVMGGAAALSGALPTMWCSMRPWPRAETRAVLQPYNVAILGITALSLAVQGAYDSRTLTAFAIALPVSLVFSRIGIMVFRAISDDTFRRLLIGLTFVSGSVLLYRELF
ncbi:MAG: sulfite exporter TauE/SafE family protein [Paracoccaceae bacterium]|nr:sulfite exporter TauE/SafE family protein [Paracoccaceae bacterium]